MRDYAELIVDLRRHHCDAKENDTQEVCEECAYDVIVADKSKFNGITDVCTCGLMHRAADAIEELLDELTTIRKQFPRWISVEERLPHYLDYVLCVNKFGIQMVGYLTDYKEGGFRCESGMDSCDYITHWMPLPTPPKGVE